MKMLTALFVSAYTLTGLSFAEDATQVKANAETAQSDTMPIGSQVQASGKIISVKAIDMVGMAEPHLMAKLKGEDGEVDILDLGAAGELKTAGIEPKEGQQLWVTGRLGRINDKEMIVVENISEAKLVSIAHNHSLRQESQKHADQRGANDTAAPASTDPKAPKVETATSQVKTIEGIVMHSRKLKIEGEAEEHTIAKVQTDEGIVMVDLGATSSLPKVDLSENQAIAATGFVGTINGKQLIIADSVGNLSAIKRDAAVK